MKTYTYCCKNCGELVSTDSERRFKRQLCSKHEKLERVVRKALKNPKLKELMSAAKSKATERIHINCKGCGCSGYLMFAPEQAEEAKLVAKEQLCPVCLQKKGAAHFLGEIKVDE